MTQSKNERIIVALTVGGVLLLCFLLSIMVYQLISIKVAKKEQKELDEKIAYYETLSEDARDTLEARSERWWIERRARELGLSYTGDKTLGD